MVKKITFIFTVFTDLSQIFWLDDFLLNFRECCQLPFLLIILDRIGAFFLNLKFKFCYQFCFEAINYWQPAWPSVQKANHLAGKPHKKILKARTKIYNTHQTL